MPHLFEPLTLRGVTFKNRIGVSPMCQYSYEDGFSNDWQLVHLGSRAVGGAGLVMVEATAVEAEGRISPGDLGLWKDDHIENLSRLTRFIKSQGAAAGIQLAHAGRKASSNIPWKGTATLSPNEGGWTPVAPSPIAFDEHSPVPTALTLEGIQKIIQKFKNAASRAFQAGFDVIEIHGAHGYLINEFHSPFSNQRSDSYGGSFENRTRFLKEVIAAIRQVWPEDKPLFVRLSATDWKEPEGWTLDQSVALALEIKKLGVDLIDCSSGGVIPGVKIPIASGYQTPLAEKIKQQAQIATAAVGMITSASQADHVIQTAQADLIFLAREFLREPYFPLQAARELGRDITWPLQYERAKRK